MHEQDYHKMIAYWWINVLSRHRSLSSINWDCRFFDCLLRAVWMSPLENSKKMMYNSEKKTMFWSKERTIVLRIRCIIRFFFKSCYNGRAAQALRKYFGFLLRFGMFIILHFDRSYNFLIIKEFIWYWALISPTC